MPETVRKARWPLLKHPVLVGAGIIVVFGLLQWAAAIRALWLLGFFSILLAAVLSFPIRWLSHIFGRGTATFLTLLVCAGALAGVIVLIAPVVSDEANQLAAAIPKAVQQVEHWVTHVRSSQPLARLTQQQTTPVETGAKVASLASEVLSKVVPFTLTVASGLSVTVLLIVLAFFFAHDPDTYRRGLVSLVPRGYEPLLDEGWRRMGATLHDWIQGVIISMAIMGALTAIGLWIVGVHGWFLLGILTFFATFVPYLGAIASAIPGLAVALTQSPRTFVWALIVYLVVHMTEGYLVSPFVMRRAVELRPGLLLFWQLIMAGIFGPLGMIVATPLLAVLKTGIDFFWVERKLGKPA